MMYYLKTLSLECLSYSKGWYKTRGLTYIIQKPGDFCLFWTERNTRLTLLLEVALKPKKESEKRKGKEG